jgi:hypothetical protein
MAIDIRDVFDPDELQTDGDDREREAELNGELFKRAYYEGGGPFSRVVNRLKTGFSVLVYLPGNCMPAAASLVKSEINGRDWKEYCEHPEGGETIVDKWKGSTGISVNWKKWISGQSAGARTDDNQASTRHSAIFHNLDFLTDWQGGIYPNTDAQTALACLVGGIRSSVVLGLSDRDVGLLPHAITRAFNEIERIDEIPSKNFHRIIPRELGKRLAQDGGKIQEGAVWLLASRLRWTDPLRAFRIMQRVALNHSTLEAILGEVLKATQTVNFLAPGEVYSDGEPRGFLDETIELLKNNIIGPFKTWKSFTGDKDDCKNLVGRLPPGLILHGPPGTGKTLLARWIAREIGLPVRTVSGSEIRAGLWGDAEKNVRNLFRDARRAAPCVIILDDADDLLPDRNTAQGGLASAERAVVNEFLQQLQGVHGRLDGVLVVLTTNRFNDLDRAAVGRLALHVRVPYPRLEKIGEIVDVIAREYSFDMSQIRDDLIERFGRSMTTGAGQDRQTAESNYFSPRDMQQAMRLLEKWDRKRPPGQPYTPDREDLQRMLDYYEELGKRTPVS